MSKFSKLKKNRSRQINFLICCHSICIILGVQFQLMTGQRHFLNDSFIAASPREITVGNNGYSFSFFCRCCRVVKSKNARGSVPAGAIYSGASRNDEGRGATQGDVDDVGDKWKLSGQWARARPPRGRESSVGRPPSRPATAQEERSESSAMLPKRALNFLGNWFLK